MAELLVGTASWTDRTLIDSGRFYPPGVRSAEGRLRHYASQFSLVEVDSSYYSLPSIRNSLLWVERTPADFTFDIKAFRLFTNHPTPRRALPKDIRESLPPPDPKARTKNLYGRHVPEELRDEVWRRFEGGIEPLHSAGKLGVVLFQFPPWFYPSNESRDHILYCQAKLPEYRLAVEFRHGSWLNQKNMERTLDFLERNDLAYVAVDEPQGFKSSVPPLAVATSDIAVIRFHGRNRETWEKRGITAAERFRYLYNDEELKEWVPRIEQMTETAEKIHILMNNCYEDYGVANAKDMGRILGITQPRLPGA